MASRTLPGLGLTGFWGTGFNGWGDAMDVNLRLLSVLVNGKVLDRVAAVPGSPADGDIYLLTAAPNDKAIAVRDNAAWVYLTPVEGWKVWVADENQFYVYTGSVWQPQSTFVSSAFDAGTKSSGIFTPDPNNGLFQFATNGGAHTLAPPTATGDYVIVLTYTNNASAGAITTSGFTKVTSAFTTTNTNKFKCVITKNNSLTSLEILQLF